ncbi:MAG: hypothetical protein ACRD2I_01960 [Vicinamibacterales bacterium]
MKTVLAVLMLTLASASVATAQAFIPPKGEGSVSFLFQDVAVKEHYYGTTPVDSGRIRTEIALVDVTYGLTDKVAVSVGLPLVAAKYTGTAAHPLVDLSGSTPTFYGSNPLDDGTYHQTLQDLRFSVRYNITRKNFWLTPFVGSVVPSHNYEYFAHAAPGTHLNELQLGVSAAKMLDALVPGLLVQGTFAYGLTGQVLEFNPNRFNMDLEVGYFLTPKLRLLALGTGQMVQDGIDVVPNPRVNLPALEYEHHDQISIDNFLNLGGGMAFTINDRFDLYGSMIHTVAKRNGHAIDHGVTVGLTWSFSTARAKDRMIASAEHALTRCVCEKGTK